MTASLYNSWLVGWILRRVDDDVKRLGMVEAMKKSINNRINLEVIGREDVVDSLKNDPVIMICNHPSQAEVLILLGLLEQRNDAYLIAGNGFLKILPNIDKHIIPVYIDYRLARGNFESFKYRLLTKFHHNEHCDKNESKKRNIESIKKASEVVNSGGLVIIFPAAGELKGKFMKGVGYMIRDLTNKKAKIIMANVRGTSTLDYLRIIPWLGKLLPKIRVTFAKPFLADRVKTSDAAETTLKLEHKYYQWVESIVTKK